MVLLSKEGLHVMAYQTKGIRMGVVRLYIFREMANFVCQSIGGVRSTLLNLKGFSWKQLETLLSEIPIRTLSHLQTMVQLFLLFCPLLGIYGHRKTSKQRCEKTMCGILIVTT